MMRFGGIAGAALAALAASGAAVNAQGGPNAAAVLSVDADYRTAAIESSAPVDGPHFRIGIRIEGARYLDGYACELGYDTSLLDFVGARAASPEEGLANFLETRGGTAVAFVGRLSLRDTALVSVGNALAGSDSSRSPGGDGLLAILAFRAKGIGTARFQGGKVELLDWRQTLDTAVVFRSGSVEIRNSIAVRAWRKVPAGAEILWLDPLGRRLADAANVAKRRAPGIRLAAPRDPRLR